MGGMGWRGRLWGRGRGSRGWLLWRLEGGGYLGDGMIIFSISFLIPCAAFSYLMILVWLVLRFYDLVARDRMRVED
jgi:hypothetical protein